MIDSDLINKVIAFSVYAPAILGTDFQRMRVLGILDYRSVFAYIDPAALHANVYPSLPPGVVNDFSKYSYLKVEFPNGQTTCLGIPWINEDTIEIIEDVTFVITVTGENISKYNAIRDALIGINVLNFKIDH